MQPILVRSFRGRHFRIVLLEDLQRPAHPEKPKNSGEFYQFIRRLGWQKREVVDHLPDVIVHEDVILAIAGTHIPATLPLLGLREVDAPFKKSRLSLIWFRRYFEEYEADVINCSIQGVTRFHLLHPKYADQVLPAAAISAQPSIIRFPLRIVKAPTHQQLQSS